MRTTLGYLRAPAMVIIGLVVCLGARADIRLGGEALTATTNNLIVSFRGGEIIRIYNRTSKEEYVLTNTPLKSLLDMPTLHGGKGPLKCTTWMAGKQNDRQEVVNAQTTFTDLDRTIWMNVKIDEETQDVLVQVWGEARSDGVRAVGWSIRGFDLSAGRLILPARGGIKLDRENAPQSLSLPYPSEWEAQMAIWEGDNGGLVLYSRDDENRYKRMELSRRGDYLDMRLDSEATAPWGKANGVPMVEWRINAYKGDWRVPAFGYRNVMHFFHKPPTVAAPFDWMQSARAAVTLTPDKATPAALEQLAKRLEPAKTLLYLPQWNRAGYEPTNAARAAIGRAHELGFRVMLDADVSAVPSASARLERYLVRDAETDVPVRRDGAPCYSPAAAPVRDAIISALRPAIEELKPDALLLTGSGTLWNDGGGVRDDHTFAQGVVTLQRALLTAFPGLALAGDGMNEVISPYSWFAARRLDGTLTPHPISSFLFGDHVLPFATEVPNPDTQPEGSLRCFARAEELGLLPSFSLAPSEASGPAEERMLRIARLWQAAELTPDWEGAWPPGAMTFKGTGGAVGALVRDARGTRMLVGNQPVYMRFTGATTVATAAFIPGWPAYDDAAIYGLDPRREYWLEYEPRPADALHLEALSPGLVLADWQVTPSFALFRLDALERRSVDLLRSVPSSRRGVEVDGKELPARPEAVEAGEATAAGDTRRALILRPPAGGAAFVDFGLNVPSTPHAFLRFRSAPLDPAEPSIVLHVVVDGKEVLTEAVQGRTWRAHQIDLSAYAGQGARVLVRASSPRGARGGVALAEPRLAIPADEPASASLRLPANEKASVLAEGGKPATEATGGATAITSIQPPATIIALRTAPPSLASGQDLGAVAHEPAVPATSVSIGGAAKAALRGARLSWAVRLPQAGKLTLGVSAGLEAAGSAWVTVRVNGVPIVEQAAGKGWTPVTADITRWQGQPVVIQLVAAGGDAAKVCWADIAVR